MEKMINRRKACKLIAGSTAALSLVPNTFYPVNAASVSTVNRNKTADEKIKAFCIDFNWGEKGFAPPGMYSHADAKEHFQWYRELGVNTIQTFCVNCCGYAWYRSSVPPVQPGMRGDFLNEITALGHDYGMRIMGYFCIGGNTYWGKTYPYLSHGAPNSRWHIPFTNEYLDYLSRSIEDVLKKTPIDGFMVDWLWNVEPTWMECEQRMYRELFNEGFPGKDNVDKEKTAKFMRLAVDRAWSRIREAAKSVKENAVIWLSCNNLKNPQVAGSRIFKEADWLMNERPDPSSLDDVKKEIGSHTRIIQCLCGWGPKHDAAKVLNDPRYADIGFYGFARPDPETTLPPTDSEDPNLAGNAKNIEIMRKAFKTM